MGWRYSGPTPTPGHPVVLPVRVQGERFYLDVPVHARKSSLFLTDTGGGTLVWADVAPRGDWTALRSGLSAVAPAPRGQPGLRVVQRPGAAADEGPSVGMLGQAWFAGRTWTFDYPGQRLLWRVAGDLPAGSRAAVYFRHGVLGRLAYPRITVAIDGQEHELLFDTGATLFLSATALAALNDGGPAERAGSFIAARVFDDWHARHPDWRVLRDADTKFPSLLIEVPEIVVAGIRVGPVWFTRRGDENYRWMSQWTDQPIVGALGGSALRYFRVTLDYECGSAVFEPAAEAPTARGGLSDANALATGHGEGA